MAALEELHEAITGELDECVEHVCALTAEVSVLSEREVVAAGAGIAALSHEAKRNLATLEQLSRHFDAGAGGGEGSLDDAVRGQTQAISEFLRGLGETLVRQGDATSGIVRVAQQIETLVAATGVLAVDLSMLTINARIEAARWGTQGAAFATVASGMRELTGEVQRVNEKIGGLATALSSLANRVVDNDKAMHALGDKLGKQVAQRLTELREAYASTQGSASSAVDLGTQLATHMLEFSKATLTNLQFQDRMAQSFREIDAMVRRSQTFTTVVLSIATVQGDEADVAAALAQAREQAGAGVIRISRESELSSSDRTMQSGVVDLF